MREQAYTLTRAPFKVRSGRAVLPGTCGDGSAPSQAKATHCVQTSANTRHPRRDSMTCECITRTALRLRLVPRALPAQVPDRAHHNPQATLFVLGVCCAEGGEKERRAPVFPGGARGEFGQAVTLTRDRSHKTLGAVGGSACRRHKSGSETGTL